MVDITLCSNESCPRRLWCVRFVCIPDPVHQSYSYFEGGEDCKYFIDINKIKYFIGH